METFNFVEVLREVGPFAAILLFFVWRDYKREFRLEERVDDLNKFVRSELMEALKRNNEILSQWKTRTSTDP
jgi:hypothetical protein